MSTTFDVYPSIAAIPTFEELLGLASQELGNYLGRIGVASSPQLRVSLMTKEGNIKQPISLSSPAIWPDEMYAWFYVDDHPGGTDAYCLKVTDEDREYWLEDRIQIRHIKDKRDYIESALSVGRYWYFRRSMGQSALINVAYGILAASLAKLTNGLVYSEDSAWDYERFPAFASDFFEWYFVPEKALEDSFRDWATGCISILREEASRTQ